MFQETHSANFFKSYETVMSANSMLFSYAQHWHQFPFQALGKMLVYICLDETELWFSCSWRLEELWWDMSSHSGVKYLYLMVLNYYCPNLFCVMSLFLRRFTWITLNQLSRPTLLYSVLVMGCLGRAVPDQASHYLSTWGSLCCKYTK